MPSGEASGGCWKIRDVSLVPFGVQRLPCFSKQLAALFQQLATWAMSWMKPFSKSFKGPFQLLPNANGRPGVLGCTAFGEGSQQQLVLLHACHITQKTAPWPYQHCISCLVLHSIPIYKYGNGMELPMFFQVHGMTSCSDHWLWSCLLWSAWNLFFPKLLPSLTLLQTPYSLQPCKPWQASHGAQAHPHPPPWWFCPCLFCLFQGAPGLFQGPWHYLFQGLHPQTRNGSQSWRAPWTFPRPHPQAQTPHHTAIPSAWLCWLLCANSGYLCIQRYQKCRGTLSRPLFQTGDVSPALLGCT